MDDKPALNELPALLAEELARIDGLNPVTGGIIRGILDDAVARAAKLEEAKTYWRDRAEAAETERNTAARRAFNAEAENQRLQRELSAAVARVAELAETLENIICALGLNPVDFSDELTEPVITGGIGALQQRVAELEAALDAERAWPSASEPPEESGDYIGYDGKSVMCVKFDAHEDADEDWPWADMDGTFVPVTRWQVLPPPPQEPR